MVTTFWHSRYRTISLLKSNQKPVHCVSVRNGIETINDLVDIEGSIKIWKIISKEFNLNPINF